MNKRENEIIQGFADSQIIKDPPQPKTVEVSETIGTEVGDNCMRVDSHGLICEGIIETEERGSCSCHMGNPPCGACTEGLLYCDECDWEEENA